MVFGFGGGNKSNSDSNNTTPAASKQDLIRGQIRQAIALEQAQDLVDTVSRNCFESCISTPLSTFTASDRASVNDCLDRYMAAWQIVSKTYVGRIQRESNAASALS